MKKRDYSLVRDGKYNMKAIMQRAWAEMKWNSHLKWFSFSRALKNAWAAAREAMEEYQDSIKPQEPVQHKEGNILKAFFVGGHPDFTNYDSSWR